jgi:hypothetical protein
VEQLSQFGEVAGLISFRKSHLRIFSARTFGRFRHSVSLKLKGEIRSSGERYGIVQSITSLCRAVALARFLSS